MHATDERRDASGLLLAILALVFWGSGPLFIKQLTLSFDAWTQNLLRYIVAALCLAPWVAAALARRRFDRAIWRRALIPSVFNVVMQCFWAKSFYYLNPGFMVLLSQSSSLWVAVISAGLFPDERPLLRKPLFWLGFLLALGGVAGVVIARPDFQVEGVATGIVLALTTALLWALYTVSVRAAFRTSSSVLSFAVISLYTCIGLAAVWLFLSDTTGIRAAQRPAWVAVVVSGALSITCAHVCFYAAIKRLGPTIPAIILLALPFTVLLPSAVIFGEALRPAQWACGMVLIAGLVAATLARSSRAGLNRRS